MAPLARTLTGKGALMLLLLLGTSAKYLDKDKDKEKEKEKEKEKYKSPKEKDLLTFEDGDVGLIVRYKSYKGRFAAEGKAKKVLTRLERYNIVSIKASRDVKKLLERDPNIEIVEFEQVHHALGWKHEDNGGGENLRRRRLAEQADYGYAMVQADQFGQIPPPPAGTPRIKVCVVDTGYWVGHPDLPTVQDGVAGWHDLNGSHGQWDFDGHGHGTHCAGVIGMKGGNGEGYIGVNPDPSRFDFFIGKGLGDNGSGTGANVMEAVQQCALNGAKVISMSLGGGGHSQIYEDAYKSIYDQGVLLVAAAGNAGNSGNHYPASYPYLMSVAAVDSSENVASFSVHNAQTEIAAPGVDVTSSIPTDANGQIYGLMSGTSMACPHVAGVAALVWSHFPACTNNQIRNVLIRTAKDKGAAGCDANYGFGIVQARAAYDLLDAQGCDAGGSGSCGSDCGIGGCLQDPNTSPPPPTPPPPPPTPSPPPPPFQCDASTESVLKVELLTDNYPRETTWEVKDLSGATVASGGPYSSKGASYVEQRCLAKETHTFTIKDKWGDGICCSEGRGQCAVYFDGKPNPDETFTSFGSSGSITLTPDIPFECDTSIKSVLKVDLTTDNYPQETSWEVKDSSGTTVASGGSYSSKGTTYVEQKCLAKETHTFTIKDSLGDGICCSYGQGQCAVYFDGKPNPEGTFTSFGSSDSTTLTPNTVNPSASKRCSDYNSVWGCKKSGLGCMWKKRQCIPY